MGKTLDASQAIAGYVKSCVERWHGSKNSSETKAQLAHLRHGMGKAPGEDSRLFLIAFDKPSWHKYLEDNVFLPEELAKAENAVYLTFVLYAIHTCYQPEVTWGMAMGKLRSSEFSAKGVVSRFTNVAGANDYEELAQYLRESVTLLGSKKIGFDFVSLAVDIYKYQFAWLVSQVRRQWGRDFVKSAKVSGENEAAVDQDNQKY